MFLRKTKENSNSLGSWRPRTKTELGSRFCPGTCLLCQPSSPIINEPGHKKRCFMPYANSKGAHQPAHPRSLISAFVIRCLDSVMSLVSVTKLSSLMLASVAEQANLSLTWSETPEDSFLVTGLKYIFP